MDYVLIFYEINQNNFKKKLQCEGQLDWIEVSSSTRSYNVTLPSENVYQFAVAANTEKYSSGMVWATCTILHNKVVGKLKTVTVDVVKKESMLLRWRLDCSDRVGIVTGYAGKIFFRKQFQRDSRLLRVVLFGGRI